jgi:hypothetical protein
MTPDGRKLSQAILESARGNFERDGYLNPMAFSLPLGESVVNIFTIDRFDDETKPMVWGQVRILRETNPVVLFLSEVWTVQASKDKPLDFINPDGTCKVMPRDHPDRKELVMLQLWEGPRAVTFCAPITRKPTALGPWEVFYDSDFPVHKATDVTGAMMEGGSYPLKNS